MTHIRCWNDHRVIRAVAARRSAPWHKLLHRQDCGRKRADLAAVITLRHHTLGIPHGMRLKLGAQDVIAPSSSSARNVRSCTALLRHRRRFLCRVGKRALAEVDHSGHFAKEIPLNRTTPFFYNRIHNNKDSENLKKGHC